MSMSNDAHYPPSQKTLYQQSPHQPRDHLFQRRRARFNCGLDPLHVVLLIVAFGIFLIAHPQYLSVQYYRNRFHSERIYEPIHQNLQEPPSKMVWQTTFTLPSSSKGCHLITKDVERAVAEGMRGVKAGIISLTIQHTSAALSLNENFDSTVRTDMNMAMDRIVPESLPWKHVDEGPDDSASHTKASLFGATITFPITNGRFNLGTWQGIYLCEFRAAKHSRRVVATILP